MAPWYGYFLAQVSNPCKAFCEFRTVYENDYLRVPYNNQKQEMSRVFWILIFYFKEGKSVYVVAGFERGDKPEGLGNAVKP